MPLLVLPTLPRLSKKKQQRRPTISQPLPSTASPHPLPSPHPSTPSLGSARGGYAISTPSTLSHSLPTPPLRPSSPLALPARALASNRQRRSGGGGVRYRDWLILPVSLGDGRDICVPDLPGHADADDATSSVTASDGGRIVQFETARVSTALAREDPELCARSARMAGGEGKGCGVDVAVDGRVEGKVDLDVVDAFLEVALEDGKGRVLRAKLARRRSGLKPGQPVMVRYDEGDYFEGEGGVLRRDRRQGDIIRGLCAFRR